MRLNYTDVKWSEFRLTAEYGRVLRATDVVTRYVFSFADEEVLSASDSFYLELRLPQIEGLFSTDKIRLSYSAGVVDSVLANERFSVLQDVHFRDSSQAVEVVAVRFRSPFSDVSTSLDFVVTKFQLVVRDLVGYNEGFFFGGRFNVDVNNIVFTLDSASSKMDSGLPDSAAVVEFVRVGLRHMIDFYLGGFTFGSVAFGGKVR